MLDSGIGAVGGNEIDYKIYILKEKLCLEAIDDTLDICNLNEIFRLLENYRIMLSKH